MEGEATRPSMLIKIAQSISYDRYFSYLFEKESREKLSLQKIYSRATGNAGPGTSGVSTAANGGYPFFDPILGFQPTLLPNLSAWYKADFSSGTGYNGAASFAGGSTQSLSCTGSNLNFGTGSFSISCWVNLTTNNGPSLVSKLGTGGYQLDCGGNNFRALLENSAGSIIGNTSNIATSTGSWTNVICTFDGTNLAVYTNNNSGSTSAITGVPANSASVFKLGDTSAGGQALTGQLDAVAVWNGVVLTASQRTTLYNSGKGIAVKDFQANGLPSPVSGYDFDGSSNLTKDYIGSNTLTNNNVVTQTVGIVRSNTSIAGDTGANYLTTDKKTDGCASFASASSQYLSSTLSPITTASLTVSCWINATSLATNNFFLSFGAGGAAKTSLNISTNKLTATVNSAATTIVGGTTINTATWYHLAVTYDGTTIKIYVNGTSDAAPVSSTFVAPSNGFTIGTRVSNDIFFNGQIDSVKIWKAALTASQITADYNSGNGVAAKDNTIAPSNLVAGYDFDSTTNLTYDYIGANTLTNNNTVTWTNGQVSSFSLADGDAVSQWNDLSGNGNNLIQATAANRPIYKANIQNNLPVVRFNGLTAAMAVTYTLNQPEQIFSVLAQQAWVSNTGLFAGITGAAMRLQTSSSSPNVKMVGGVNSSLTAAITVGAFHSVQPIFNGVSSSMQVDSSVVLSNQPLGTTGAGGITLGALEGGSSNAQVDIGEWGVTSSINNQQTTIYNYLKGRYNTP